MRKIILCVGLIFAVSDVGAVEIDGSCSVKKTVFDGCEDGYYAVGEACFSCPIFALSGSSPKSHVRNLEITNCYVVPGTYSDAAGTFTVSQNCWYQE